MFFISAAKRVLENANTNTNALLELAERAVGLYDSDNKSIDSAEWIKEGILLKERQKEHKVLLSSRNSVPLKYLNIVKREMDKIQHTRKSAIVAVQSYGIFAVESILVALSIKGSLVRILLASENHWCERLAKVTRDVPSFYIVPLMHQLLSIHLATLTKEEIFNAVFVH